MDTHYNREAAKDTLEKLLSTRLAEVQGKDDPSIQHLSGVQVNNLVVQETGDKRKLWRVGPANESGDMECETVFRVQGALSRVDLVARSSMGRSKATKAANFSQRVQIVGLGSALFDQAVANASLVQATFGRYFAGQTVTAWPVGTAEVFINASTRYFTRAVDDRAATAVAFGRGVDPLNALGPFNAQGLIHTEDNIVKYYKLVTDRGEPRYHSATPAEFRVGDLVEIRGTIVAFPSKANEIKTYYHMSSLIRLDTKYSIAAEDAKAAEWSKMHMQFAPASTMLRRNAAHLEEDEDVLRAHKKFKDMSVIDRAEKS
ncbi:hypothetical protein B0H17DRAFT_1123521 [Mycena rosella]|uniref:Uncharacterized protein n=1 Tax=Mycena rosella TaxID=1033263 RepID=A0AAD7H2A8_MYCRO|nr:hypothetical protein B0H17DRAFT_1123521 [Mycena rosella]